MNINEDEAREFCRLLTLALRREGMIDESWIGTLPRPDEMIFVEKAGVSDVPSGDKARLRGDKNLEALRDAALRNDGIVRENIKRYRNPRHLASVHLGLPNDLGIVLGQVGTWSDGLHQSGRARIIGPSFNDHPELIKPEPWHFRWHQPETFGMPRQEVFPFAAGGWFPGKSQTRPSSSRTSNVGLYVVLRRSEELRNESRSPVPWASIRITP